MFAVESAIDEICRGRERPTSDERKLSDLLRLFKSDYRDFLDLLPDTYSGLDVIFIEFYLVDAFERFCVILGSFGIVKGFELFFTKNGAFISPDFLENKSFECLLSMCLERREDWKSAGV